MRRIKVTLTALCAVTLLTAATAPAQGTLPDRKTIVTVSAPVSVPGTTLPAGTYVFKLAESPANRNIVQVFDRDEAKLITTLLAVPAERAEAAGDPLITFKETPADRPPAVRYWYYAGEKSGNEFVYPKAQAMMIARASGESVSAVDTDATDIEGLKKGEVTRVTANAEPQSTTSSSTSTTTSTATTTAATTTAPTTAAPTTTAPEPAQPPVTTAPATPAPTPTEPAPTAAPAPATPAPSMTASQPEQPVGTSGRTEALPRTASELPTVGLIGLVALAGAFGVSLARRSLV
jgi:hypothetical protein